MITLFLLILTISGVVYIPSVALWTAFVIESIIKSIFLLRIINVIGNQMTEVEELKMIILKTLNEGKKR